MAVHEVHGVALGTEEGHDAGQGVAQGDALGRGRPIPEKLAGDAPAQSQGLGRPGASQVSSVGIGLGIAQSMAEDVGLDCVGVVREGPRVGRWMQGSEALGELHMVLGTLAQAEAHANGERHAQNLDPLALDGAVQGRADPPGILGLAGQKLVAVHVDEASEMLSPYRLCGAALSGRTALERDGRLDEHDGRQRAGGRHLADEVQSALLAEAAAAGVVVEDTGGVVDG